MKALNFNWETKEDAKDLGAGNGIIRTILLKDNSVRKVVDDFKCRRLGVGNPAWVNFKFRQ